MGKAKYKTTPISRLDFGAVSSAVGSRCVLGIDVAKRVQFVSFSGEDGKLRGLFKWSFPDETARFVRLCQRLQEDGVHVQAVLEPSGTYSTAIRYALAQANVETFRISGKRVHDAKEVFDGVPSSHDAKSAAILTWLHSTGISTAWEFESNERRAMAASCAAVERYDALLKRRRSQLEARMSLHWPELEMCLSLERASALKLIRDFGSAQAVMSRPAEARRLMRKTGGHFLLAKVIDQVLESARLPRGLPPIAEESEALSVLASEVLDAHKCLDAAKRKLSRLSERNAPEPMRAMVGSVTAGVLLGVGLDPRKSESPKSYEKAIGLNLWEQSSGTKNSGMHITKRGNGLARRWLFFVALRLIKDDPVVKAWFERRKLRNGKQGIKGVVAVMRKLAKALWYVARGADFDAQLLFDVRKLAQPEKALIITRGAAG